jgi:hypothetical protein
MKKGDLAVLLLVMGWLSLVAWVVCHVVGGQ